jgi:hypothetical protein
MRLGFFTECFTKCFRDCSFWGCWEFFLLVLGLAAFVVVFEVILGCPFEFAGRRTRARVVRWEIVRFVSGGWRRPTLVQSLLGAFYNDANPT